MHMSFSALFASVLILASARSGATTEAAVKKDLARQAERSYTAMLLDGVASGRFFAREATVSGMKRHTEEFIARQYLAPRTAVSHK